MKEPEVRAITPPISEPTLRVGIVLPEDKKTQITIASNNSPITIGARAGLTGQFEVAIKARQLEVSSANGTWVSPAPLKIQCGSPLAPKSGITVHNIVAGRGFHWEKQISQTFDGELEIHILGQHLILVNLVKLESYIASVITSEMSSECPAEFAKAQAVAARSWASVFLGHKHQGLPFTICNDDDCQRYQGTTHLTDLALSSVRGCSGEFLVDKNGNLCAAYYSKSCGGASETARDIFGFDAPGCEAIVDSINGAPFCSPEIIDETLLPRYLGAVDQNGKYYRWSYQLNPATLVKNLRERFNVECSKVTDLKPTSRSHSGRILTASLVYQDSNANSKTFELTNQYDIRRALHESFLLSSAFEVEKIGDKITLHGSGWGHGVGLCQIGAVGMSLKGYNYKEILNHYYRNTKLVKGY